METLELPEDKIVTSLYRRFKEWSARGFTADDVTWCEVKSEIQDLIKAELAALRQENERLAKEYQDSEERSREWMHKYHERVTESQSLHSEFCDFIEDAGRTAGMQTGRASFWDNPLPERRKLVLERIKALSNTAKGGE